MDALSDLLRLLRFSGGVFLDASFKAPWSVLSQVTEEDCPSGVTPMAGLIAFHYVLDGELHLRVEDLPARHCKAGDLIVLLRNDVHAMGSDLTLPALRAGKLIRKVDEDAMPRIDFGDGALLCRLVCGFLATSVPVDPLRAALPRLLVVGMRERSCADWVESSFRHAASTYATREAGAQDLLARLIELLFVEAVRSHIAQLPPTAVGWLAALRDPALARVLSALHARVDQAWTTEQLAEVARLSRSAFAERFVRVLGVPPMTYLTQWRMQLACCRLRESPLSIARIAAEVGYESESTFTRAFTREIGMAPGAYRRGEKPAHPA